MTDDFPPPDPAPALPADPPPPPAPAAAAGPTAAPPPRRALWPLLGVIAFLLLAAGEAYLFQQQRQASNDGAKIAALQSQIAGLQQMPAPVPAAANAPAADLAPKLAALSAQLAALQTLFTADHGALITLQANNIDLTKFSTQLDALQTQSTADHATLAALQSATTNLDKLTAKITLLGRLDAARMALDAGQPLGDIPDAPPTLAQYAGTPPPTQAELILSFPAAARAAESASVGADGKRSYWSNVLARLENLITISNGTHVVIGVPAAAVIAQAQAALNAGDLAGAVAVIDTLSTTTQAAMGDWLARARALLAARAAIVSLASAG
jgi:hypothetical protein